MITRSLLIILLGGLCQCTQPPKCPPMKHEVIVKEIQDASPDYRLNIYATPSLLLINGAKVAKISEGKLSNQNTDDVYTPLLEAVYSEFKVRGDDPYREIIIHAHEKLPRPLLKLIQNTALSTHLAPVILMPVDYSVTTCTYTKSRHTNRSGKTLALKNNILIRQEKDRILVDGRVVISLTNEKLPDSAMGSRKIVIMPLLATLKARLAKLPEGVTPVLHITYDADLAVTKYILITAGKAGIYKLKTVRVLP